MALHKDITVHPGRLLLDCYIKPSGFNLTETAKKLDVSTAQLSRLTSCKSAMSVDMAKKLEGLFKRTAKAWMISQVNYDLANHK
ncbi:DNA-binding domain protein [Vibrio phage 1.236.O._10N.261.52.C4]|nr:DNA-binding domain protein [Vibrio phage 1.236.O._10N.261.52.C4]